MRAPSTPKQVVIQYYLDPETNKYVYELNIRQKVTMTKGQVDMLKKSSNTKQIGRLLVNNLEYLVDNLSEGDIEFVFEELE